MQFTFHNPTKIIFGKGSISQLGGELSANGIKKILLVAGGGSVRSNGVHKQVLDSLRFSSIACAELWGVHPNPALSKVREGIAIAKKEEVEAVLAVGGGSVIDTAKAIAAGFFMNEVWDAFERREGIRNALPVFVVLTISATGSEMNDIAVITNEEEKKKWAVHSSLLFPKVSFIDPSVQNSLPWSQTANGAIDSLSHVMEYYFLGKDEEATLAMDEALMRTTISSADRLKKDQKDENARSSLAWAATLALNGLTGAGLGSGDFYSHGIENTMSGLYPEIAHAAGLAAIFPAWISYMRNENPGMFARWAREVWKQDGAEKGVQAMKAKFNSWGAPTSLRELGLKRDGLALIADKFMQRGSRGGMRNLSRQDILNILDLAF